MAIEKNTDPAADDVGLIVRAITTPSPSGDPTVVEPEPGSVWVSSPDPGAAWPSYPAPAANSTRSSVAGSASAVTVLAANASRRGATIFNDSTAILYLALGSAATTSSYTVAMVSNSYYEVPFGYTGIITGIWASATGNARVDELTA